MSGGEVAQSASGQGPIEFKIGTPVDNETVLANISHALSLGLPEADDEQLPLHLIANGPSAADFFGHPHSGADTMALNGALGLFTSRNDAPAYWCACDPQEMVAGFLSRAPKSTTYLVASKCHPRVFSRLSSHDTRLWHVNDQIIPGKRQVPCAVSVTLCALILAHRLGYRHIDVWGWDCCFAEDGSHHASGGTLSNTSDAIEIEVELKAGGVKRFMSTATWACEFQDARGILPVLKWCGTDVVIHGRSMVAAILPEFAA